MQLAETVCFLRDSCSDSVYSSGDITISSDGFHDHDLDTVFSEDYTDILEAVQKELQWSDANDIPCSTSLTGSNDNPNEDIKSDCKLQLKTNEELSGQADDAKFDFSELEEELCRSSLLNSYINNYYSDFRQRAVTIASTSQARSHNDAETFYLPFTFTEDREFDFLKAQRITRCSSLKSSLSSEKSSCQKKTVRFADALGLDLVAVRHIINAEEPPLISCLAANYDFKQAPRRVPQAQDQITSVKMCPCFCQPGESPDFLRRVQERKISLATCDVDDDFRLVRGSVRVANIAYEKQVTVRYSTNSWLTYSDSSATYVPQSNDGITDTFSFILQMEPHIHVASKIEFSIRYVAGHQTYWDNNFGSNYSIQCYEYKR